MFAVLFEHFLTWFVPKVPVLMMQIKQVERLMEFRAKLQLMTFPPKSNNPKGKHLSSQVVSFEPSV